MNIQPDFLCPGDKVAIVCTARKLSAVEAQQAVDLLKSWGLVPVLGKTIGLDEHQLGGTDQQRAEDFNTQLQDPTIKAIWCARGGYGSVRIVDQINWNALLTNPKWIVGFSDVTVLHSHANRIGVKTLHAIMAFSVAHSTQQSIDSLYYALFGKELSYTLSSNPNNICGSATAELVGGNLSILYSLLGSESSISTRGKILFIEDLDEYLYHVDRMMYNLHRNGLLSEIKGLIIGGMTKMRDNDIPFGLNAQQIITALVQKYNYPVVFDFPSGHDHTNLALPLGSSVTLEVDEHQTKLSIN